MLVNGVTWTETPPTSGSVSTPAMAAGVSDKLWSLEDIAERIEANRPKPGKRGPYKRQPVS